MLNNYYHEEFSRARQFMMDTYNQNKMYVNESYASKKISDKEFRSIKLDFNDICLREMGLDVEEDNNHVYDIEDGSVLVVTDKFIRYFYEDEDIKVAHNEIELNLIENPRLMEVMFNHYMVKYAAKKGWNITSIYQSNNIGSSNGIFVITYIEEYSNTGETKNLQSDSFLNESLRIFNLICKLNHRTHLYKDLSRFNIPSTKGGKQYA